MITIFQISKNVSCLAFDLGNTLYPHSIQKKSWENALEGWNIDEGLFFSCYQTDFQPNPGGFSNPHKLIHVFNLMNHKLSEIEIKELLDKYKISLRKLIDEHLSDDPDDTFSFLSQIKNHFDNIGILSDNTIETKNEWSKLLKANNLDVFDFFVVSEEIKSEKPNSLTFNSLKQKCMTPLDTSEINNGIIYFGDDLIKDKGAIDHGMRFVHVYGHRNNKSDYLPQIRYINNEWLKQKF